MSTGIIDHKLRLTFKGPYDTSLPHGSELFKKRGWYTIGTLHPNIIKLPPTLHSLRKHIQEIKDAPTYREHKHGIRTTKILHIPKK